MKTYDEIFQDVIQIMQRCSDKPLPEINLNDNLKAGLGFDSVAMVNLQISLEDEYNFIFDPIEDDFDQIFSSVKNICDYLKDIVK